MNEIPQAALKAAVTALLATRGETRVDNVRQQAQAALKAAAPLIAAAERQRIRQLAIDHDAVFKSDPYQMDYESFADLLTDPEPQP